MGSASRTSAWVAAAGAAAPVVLTPSVAWAASDTAVIAASAISGVVGAALGAGVAGGLGYRALRREREAYEELLYGQGVAPRPVRQAAPASSAPSRQAAKGPKVAPSHAALSAASDAPQGAHPARHVSEGNPYLEALSDTRDLDQVAVAYVADKSLKSRMAQKAKGVRQVLSERMGKNMLDDMPVIMRADGSVGDVGTSWWDPAVSSAFGVQAIEARELSNQVSARPEGVPAAVTSVPRVPQVPEAPAIPSAAQAPMPAPASPRASTPAPAAKAPASSSMAAGPTVAQIIASRVASVVEEAYPEVDRSWNAGENWERALAALDERVEDNLMGTRLDAAYRTFEQTRAASVAAFSDGIGTIETIDEPDGLERDTTFLTFKAPGNHPEVQDTASYINYLIGDEFRRNPSEQARHHAKSYLRLHEGGTHAQPQVQAM